MQCCLGKASGLEKELQTQLVEAEARRKGLEALRLEVAAAREGAAEAKAAEAVVRNEAEQFSREQLELEVRDAQCSYEIAVQICFAISK